MRQFLILFLMTGLLAPTLAVAEEEAVPQVTKDPLIEAQKDAIDNTNMLLAKLVKDLDEAQRRHLMFTYSNYNLIQTTEAVKTDVEDAVQQCGAENPDMKEALDARFKDWQGALDPVLEEAQSNLDNMVLVQEYAPKKKIREVFKSVDNAREKTDARFEKTPVTTKEACTYLLGKMDDTQDNLTSLLRQTLVSFSQISPKLEEAEKAAKENPKENSKENKEETKE